MVIVTSGAVGAGAARMGVGARPKDLAAKQALAAVGQVHLMRYYDDFFGALRLPCAQANWGGGGGGGRRESAARSARREAAWWRQGRPSARTPVLQRPPRLHALQVLLTLDNLASRPQHLCAAATFAALFERGAVPIVNENDTVAVAELRFGDNDTLSAHVASLVRADWLFLLTDVDGLYTAHPATPGAVRLPEVADLASLQAREGGGSGRVAVKGGVRSARARLRPVLHPCPTNPASTLSPHPFRSRWTHRRRERSGARGAWPPS